MANFVLIHGAWHGGWCWKAIIPMLEAAGHKAYAPDLASLGEDATPLAAITLDSWCNDIKRLIESIDGPVVLVGHSRGGIVISQVAEMVPNRIAALVYVTAALLGNGDSILSFMQQNMDPEHAGQWMTMDMEKMVISMNLDNAAAMFYNTCSADAAAESIARLKPESLQPWIQPLQLSDAGYGSVARHYVRTAQDLVITPELQDTMVALQPSGMQSITTLDCDHSPMICQPEKLVGALLAIEAYDG